MTGPRNKETPPRLEEFVDCLNAARAAIAQSNSELAEFERLAFEANEREKELEARLVAAEEALRRFRQAAEIELARHQCYTSPYAQARFWKQVAERAEAVPEENQR